jgi:hypothetical protein
LLNAFVRFGKGKLILDNVDAKRRTIFHHCCLGRSLDILLYATQMADQDLLYARDKDDMLAIDYAFLSGHYRVVSSIQMPLSR